MTRNTELRVFAIVIMGGMASLWGCVLAALAFGVAENVTAALYGPAWSPAVAFGDEAAATGGAGGRSAKTESPAS